jgi:hypothetical protein
MSACWEMSTQDTSSRYRRTSRSDQATELPCSGLSTPSRCLISSGVTKLEAPVETDMHVVYDRTPNTKPPAANTFEPEELEKATSFTSQPSLRALIVSTALK